MKIYKGKIFHIIDNPFEKDERHCYEYYDPGVLIIDDEGKIEYVGLAYQKYKEYNRDDNVVIDCSSCLIIPGLIDTHIHFPQINMRGAFGEELLEWLNNFTFPVEKKFENDEYAKMTAKYFWRSLVENGTTTSVVYSTIHKNATNILFETAFEKGMRSIIGKVMMDRNAPAELIESPEKSCEDSEELYHKWHGIDHLQYIFSPRFAITSTDKALSMVGDLYRKYQDAYLQSHLSENINEIDEIQKLFPKHKSYTDVYHRYGLLGHRTLMGHGIYLSDEEMKTIRSTETVIAHCPSSNMFLGSGLYPMKTHLDRGIRVSLASDVGGGNKISMFGVMEECYKVQKFLKFPLSPIKLLYLSTLGNAKALNMGNKIGNFTTGKEADFLVIDVNRSEEILRHIECTGRNIINILSAIIFLTHKNVIRDVYVCGKKVNG